MQYLNTRYAQHGQLANFSEVHKALPSAAGTALPSQKKVVSETSFERPKPGAHLRPPPQAKTGRMRLLNVHSMQLEEYFGSSIPMYTILSHCWGAEEVLFHDIGNPTWKDKRRADKIGFACKQSKKDGFEYLWVDTCCIDKSSSAELSEAINSMYTWYAQAQVCYAYLEDVDTAESSEAPAYSQLQESKWFTRGWTLQELIAPRDVAFYDRQWTHLGMRKSLADTISKRTRIPATILIKPGEARYTSVARRMSWAAGRKTTRVEDVAYCLMGLFDVHLPLLYGEGTRAFIRLQEEILKQSDDQSLFAWHGYRRVLRHRPGDELLPSGALAASPSVFRNSGSIVPFSTEVKIVSHPYTMTNKGLRIELRLSEWKQKPSILLPIYYVALLDCQYENDFTGCIGIILRKISAAPTVFTRMSPVMGLDVVKVDIEAMKQSVLRTIYIQKNSQLDNGHPKYETCQVQFTGSAQDLGFQIGETVPKELPWNGDSRTLQISTIGYKLSLVAFQVFSVSLGINFVVLLQVSMASDYARLKISTSLNGIASGDWLEGEEGSHFDRTKDRIQVSTKSESSTKQREDGRCFDITAHVKECELLKQEVWALEIDVKAQDPKSRLA